MAKILVIEDEDQQRVLLKKMLTHIGHQVFIAEDGVEGIKIFHEIQPDLIITDIIMPNKDGIEVIIELLKFNPELPIIAVSGGRRAITANFNLDSAEMLGVKGILQKPFTHEQLLELVEKVLS
jgi:CheY-like chemotaxis protein